MSRSVPNLLIVNPCQFRGDGLSHFWKSKAVSPNLDALVETEAISFRNAFTTSPDSSLASLSFLSGNNPSSFGSRHPGFGLNANEPNFLSNLKENGYVIWWWGRNDISSANASPDPYCHVRYNGAGARRVPWQLDKELEWRGSNTKNNYYSFYVGELDREGDSVYHDKDWDNIDTITELIHSFPRNPFCIFLSLTYPHPPYAVEDSYLQAVRSSGIPERIPRPPGWVGKPAILKGISERQNLGKWSETQWRELRNTYYAMCRRVDDQFGRVLQALKETGIYDDTAIVFTSENGDYAGDYGLVEKNLNTFEDSLIRIPLVFKPPKSIACKPGFRNALVQITDVVPTLEELTGIHFTSVRNGHSLLRYTETDVSLKHSVYAEGGWLPEQSERPGCGLQCPSSELYWPRRGLEGSENPMANRAKMVRTLRFKYVKRDGERDEFYDLKNDPYELTNQIENSLFSEKILELQKELYSYTADTQELSPNLFSTPKTGG